MLWSLMSEMSSGNTTPVRHYFKVCKKRKKKWWLFHFQYFSSCEVLIFRFLLFLLVHRSSASFIHSVDLLSRCKKRKKKARTVANLFHLLCIFIFRFEIYAKWSKVDFYLYCQKIFFLVIVVLRCQFLSFIGWYLNLACDGAFELRTKCRKQIRRKSYSIPESLTVKWFFFYCVAFYFNRTLLQKDVFSFIWLVYTILSPYFSFTFF